MDDQQKQKKEVLVVFIKRNKNNKLVTITSTGLYTPVLPQVLKLLSNSKEKTVVVFLDNLTTVEYIQFNAGRIIGHVVIGVSYLSNLVLRSTWMLIVGFFAIILFAILFLVNQDFLPLVVTYIQNSKIYTKILDFVSKNIYTGNESFIFIPTFFYFKPKTSVSFFKETEVFLVAQAFSTCLFSFSLLDIIKKTNEQFKSISL